MWPRPRISPTYIGDAVFYRLTLHMCTLLYCPLLPSLLISPLVQHHCSLFSYCNMSWLTQVSFTAEQISEELCRGISAPEEGVKRKKAKRCGVVHLFDRCWCTLLALEPLWRENTQPLILWKFTILPTSHCLTKTFIFNPFTPKLKTYIPPTF